MAIAELRLDPRSERGRHIKKGRYRPQNIEDYGLIGDCKTAALVGRNGSIDWLCWPRFDAGSCFAALLGDDRHGRWWIGPVETKPSAGRSYRENSMVLESVFESGGASFAVIDFMPIGRSDTSVVRMVEGRSGLAKVRSKMTL